MELGKPATRKWPAAARRGGLALLFCALPAVLLISSVRVFRALQEQRTIYLRSRAANLAARLETLPSGAPEASLEEALAEEEPALQRLTVIARGQAGLNDPVLERIWNGRQLFHTEFTSAGSQEIFRAYVPFHSPAGLRIALIDLNANSADFLVAHARHNLLFASLSGLALVALAFYAVWSSRQRAALERHQLELEHLAHIGKMSAVLAHEIRNPLGTIKGFVQLAIERTGQSATGLLNPVLKETARLEDLVNDLLLYGRPPAPVMRDVQWPSVHESLRAHAAALAGGRSVDFVSADDPVGFRTDPALLEQVLLNLLRNAFEAASEGQGGKVAMRISRRPAGGVEISIADNGPGLAESVRSRLFEPFATTKASGTGLGLAISQKLVSALGGSLELRDMEPHGVEAVILLPDGSYGIHSHRG